MKIAAIDIGSNAIRFQVSNVIINSNNKPVFKRIEYIRFPLRLGHDVFTIGYITDENKEKFLKLMQAYKLLLDLYKVDDYSACATSAMRESTNSTEIIKLVKSKIGLNIELIDGEQEANLISSAIREFLIDETILHIDVGGGSTELNLYFDGEIVASKSFKIGSVRRLEQHDTSESWTSMRNWIHENIKNKHGSISAIGTGGNINKLFDLANQKNGKTISLNKIKSVVTTLQSYSYEERQRLLNLNADRADVIMPASEIYVTVMEWAGAKEITVPNVGLKDGLLLETYNRIKKI